jgi:tRNA1(Val) A37 N6-methylase TrmN6
VATDATLEGWIHAARRILKSGGVLTMIWRADGLVEVLAALDRGFGSLAILPVHGDAASPAIRVLVRAIKGGKAPTAATRRADAQ